MPTWLAIAVFVIVIAQGLCVFAVIVLAVAGRQVFVAVNVFGFLLALRSGTLGLYGFIKGELPSRKRAVSRTTEPLRYWSLVLGSVVGVCVGAFLMSLPIT
jgi:hypothetical protein